MPALVVDDITILPRIPAPDPAIARERAVRSVTTAPQRLRRGGVPGPPRLRRRRARGPRPVRPSRPDGRGRVRARRGEGHAVASAPRLRDRHLHDRRHVRAPGLERRRWPHHQRRHAVDDRGFRDPPHREAAGGARAQRWAVPRLPALGQPPGRPEMVAAALPGHPCAGGRAAVVAGWRRAGPRDRGRRRRATRARVRPTAR